MASKLILLAVLMVASVAMVSARFLVIPIEDVHFVNGVPYLPHPQMPHHRIARRAVIDDIEPETAADSSYGSSSYAADDHVDYGAYTGGYGAFGWYADFPVGGDQYGKH